jgi:adenosylcobinamide kinase/adenosylcobinamide-phosphate guanylyltransferase
MILILGGYAQGRRAYAMKTYGLTERDIWDAASKTPWKDDKRLILHPEALVTQWLGDGKDPAAMTLQCLPQWQNAVVIAQEVGCGLVPVEKEDRRWREAVGKMHQILAQHATCVERICCGLSMRLKGA